EDRQRAHRNRPRFRLQAAALNGARAMAIVRALLNLRSMHWKVICVVAAACVAMALTVGLLVHESTLERSMNEGAGKAVVALDEAVRSARSSGVEPPRAVPGETPEPLLQ